MSSLNQALSQLKEERSLFVVKVTKLDEAIGVLTEISTGKKPSVSVPAGEVKPKRFVSASVRRRIARAQRARWAAIRAKEKKAA